VFKAGARIAQLIIEIVNADTMEVDDLEVTKGGEMGFGSSDLNPKRSITAKEAEVKIWLLHTDTSDNKFFRAADIRYHPQLMQGRIMLSSAHVNAALTRTMHDSFLDRMRVAGKKE